MNQHALLGALAPMNITFSHMQLEQLAAYARLLREWNQNINLTAITDPKAIAVSHFADSLSVLSVVEIKKNASIIDVGTGAGFPGLPLKIARPDLALTLLDSNNKKLLFLREVVDQLGLTGVTLVHDRAETAAKTALRERFDIAAARAVAPLNQLAEYTLPFVRAGGCFLALKGPKAAEEIAQAQNAITQLGGRFEANFAVNLQDTVERRIICVKKISQTPTQYPRPFAKIAKSPL